MKPNFLILLFSSLLLFGRCGDGEVAKEAPTVTNSDSKPSSTPTATAPTLTTPKDAAPLAAQELLVWVNKLNVRRRPNTKSKVLHQLRQNSRVRFTGEESDELQTIQLRGKSYTSRWVKIQQGKKEGWVFGGALSIVGNEVISPFQQYINFEKFGRYNLTDWTLIGDNETEGGDAESQTLIYENKDGYKLVLGKTEIGEYGYNRIYQLLDKNHNTLKVRTFQYQADLDQLMTETVYDFTANPAQVYTRTQNFNASPRTVGYAPENIVGEAYTATTVSDEAKVNYQPKATINGLSMADLSNFKDTGCSCSFEATREDSSAQYVFLHDMEGNGGVKINEEVVEMNGEQTDNIAHLQELSRSKDWIVLRAKGGITVFGEVVDIKNNNNWYNDARNDLIDVLWTMETLPKKIPIRKVGQIGMGTRAEFKSMCEEAIQLVKTGKAKGENRIPTEFTYNGGGYECYVKLNQIGRNDGGGQLFEGTLFLFNQYGVLVNEKAIKGDCGC